MDIYKYSNYNHFSIEIGGVFSIIVLSSGLVDGCGLHECFL